MASLAANSAPVTKVVRMIAALEGMRAFGSPRVARSPRTGRRARGRPTRASNARGVRPAVAKPSTRTAYAVWGTPYIFDLTDFAVHFLEAKGVTGAGLRTATTNVQAWAASFVIRVWNGAKMSMCGEVTSYFGSGSDWPGSSSVYLATAFAADAGWGTFQVAYNG